MNYEKENALVNEDSIVLDGTVLDYKFSHEILGESFYNLTLEVSRFSETKDYIPVTISERLRNNIKIGDRLSIEGQIRTYNKYMDSKRRLEVLVFAQKIINDEDIENSNHLHMTGFICTKPLYRVTPFNREICDVMLAVNRPNGNCFHVPCIAWGRNAKYLAYQLAVGDEIEIEGRFQSREYEKKSENGEIEKRTAYEVSISKIKLLNKTNKHKVKSLDADDADDDASQPGA